MKGPAWEIWRQGTDPGLSDFSWQSARPPSQEPGQAALVCRPKADISTHRTEVILHQPSGGLPVDDHEVADTYVL